MLEGLGYLDCRMMVLGTKMTIAKNNVDFAVRHAFPIATEKVGKVSSIVKDKVKNIKIKKNKSEKAEETVEAENVVSEETDFREVVIEDAEFVAVPQGMNIHVVPEEESVQNGPDFSLLRGVTYDPETDNLKVEPIVENDGIPKPVTEADLKIALEKMRANQQPKDDGHIVVPT